MKEVYHLAMQSEEAEEPMAEELTYNYWGVIKMSVNTNIFAEKFVF